MRLRPLIVLMPILFGCGSTPSRTIRPDGGPCGATTPVCQSDADCSGDTRCIGTACVPKLASPKLISGPVSLLSGVSVPTNPDDCCIDIDGDGKFDNLLAAAVSLVPQAANVQNLIDTATQMGRFKYLVEFRKLPEGGCGEAALSLYTAFDDLDLDGRPDVPLNQELAGTGIFEVTADGVRNDGFGAAVQLNGATMENGVLRSRPATLLFDYVLYGGTPIKVPVQNAVMQFNLGTNSGLRAQSENATDLGVGGGIGSASIGGYIRVSDMIDQFNANAKNCACAGVDPKVPLGTYSLEGGSFSAACSGPHAENDDACGPDSPYTCHNLDASCRSLVLLGSLADIASGAKDSQGHVVKDSLSFGIYATLSQAMIAPAEVAPSFSAVGDHYSNNKTLIVKTGIASYLDVLANDIFDESATHVISSVDRSGAQGGGIEISGSGGGLVYTPQSGFLGEETFHYTITNATGVTSTAQVTVRVVTSTRVPRHLPEGVTFHDTDRQIGQIGGSVTIQRAVDETDIDSYRVYWGSDATTKLQAAPIVELPKIGEDLSYILPAQSLPSGATHLLVWSANLIGEAASPVATQIVDSPRFTDISQPSQRSSAPNPTVQKQHLSTVVDEDNHQLLIVGASDDNSRKLELNRCDLSTLSCSYQVLFNQQNSGNAPSAVIDPINHKLLVVAQDDSDSAFFAAPTLTTCDLDGSNCSTKTISPVASPTIRHTGVDPAAVLDTSDAQNPRLLIAVGDYSFIVGQLGIYSCDLQGNNCTLSNPLAVDNTLAFDILPAVADDTVHHKLIVAAHDTNASDTTATGHLGLYTCDLDGMNCMHQDLSAVAGLGQDSGLYPAVTFDETAATLFVSSQDVGNQNHLALFRCTLSDISATWDCTYADPTTSHGANAGFTPSLQISDGSLLIVVQDGSKSLQPALYTCPVTGGDCLYDDLAAGSPIDSSYFPAAAIDRTNDHLYIGAEYFDQSTYRPVLFDFPLK
jgi:hypothetical protein